MANVIKFACKFCGQEINTPAPQQAGMYVISCPHCKKQMRVKYTPRPISMASSPQTSQSSPASNTENVRHSPTRRFNDSMGPSWKESSLQEPKIVGNVGRLSMVRLGFDKEYFPLRIGENTIGRKDPTQPSDIEIGDDETMSRRSVMITVSEAGGGYTYKLTVLKTFNPVLVNGVSLAVGQSMHLSIGASLCLGQTVLRLEK